jgi:adenylate cyclase
MAEKRAQRRLAAILAADVVGYSRLMRADEAGTLAQLNAIRTELLDPKIAEYGGRIVKTTGDGILIEFPSAVDAVQYADNVQQVMAQRNASVPVDLRMELRMGINVGDVIVEDNDLFGDGVNVAARLEGLAAPGGIYVSGNVYEQVRHKVDLAFEDMGEQSVKNIDEPVRVYRIGVDGGGLASAVAVGDREQPLPLPDKPSIAVLPFNNMSGDPEQEYFSDGVSEDIITALSRIRWFFVIARNTSFAYKGQAVDMQGAAKEMGVRYVLEGSVRKSGNRIRITAQLIDGTTGIHVWAKRYDRDLEDIFDLQDEITETIVGAIEPEMARTERERAKAKRPDNLQAWDLFQRAMWHTYHRTRDDLEEAQRLFALAREADPGLASAYAGAEEACFFQTIGGFVESAEETKAEAVRLGLRAVELDRRDAFARYALGRALTLVRDHPAAIPELESAVKLNPSSAQAHYALGMALGTSGRPADALAPIETAMRLSPHDPYIGQFMTHMAEALLFLRRHDEALEWARQSLRQPRIVFSRWAMLISILGHMGKTEEARQSIESLNRVKPDVDVEFVRNYWPISDVASMDYLLEGLTKAGLPEWHAPADNIAQ